MDRRLIAGTHREHAALNPRQVNGTAVANVVGQATVYANDHARCKGAFQMTTIFALFLSAASAAAECLDPAGGIVKVTHSAIQIGDERHVIRGAEGVQREFDWLVTAYGPEAGEAFLAGRGIPAANATLIAAGAAMMNPFHLFLGVAMLGVSAERRSDLELMLCAGPLPEDPAIAQLPEAAGE